MVRWLPICSYPPISSISNRLPILHFISNSIHVVAVNQIQFGNKGELYINLGSNTNGGEPGRLSGSGRMKENYFSASTIVADLSHPNFDGFIEYDAPDDGSPINFYGISVFAPGLRNPFGLTLHSNGYLYATDNGPNTGYGKMRVGCSPSDLLTDQQREDKLVRLISNKYYGHPNPKRAAYHKDPRQCVWRNPTEPTSANYQAPLGVVLSSATGIIEYQADHFNRQLRGNLIHVKYKSGLLRTVLSPNGLTANPLTIPGLKLLGQNGLDVAQAPNGNLIEVRYTTSSLYVSRPIETTTAALRVSAVFPTRGSVAGGTRLRIYGWNFGTTSSDVTVTIGGSACSLVAQVLQTNYMQCTLPGKPEGIYDIVVTALAGTYTFSKGYRYI
jgi:IPT/TIG domain/Glucose / Sorbosone dehydrogenase